MPRIKNLFRLAAGFFFFLLFMGISGWITLVIITSGGDVVIPDIIGKDLKSALGTLQSKQFYIVLDSEEFHPEAPRGAIIAQNPAAGETRKSFSTVRVILSAGPNRLEMPDFRGFGVRQARLEMRNLNIGAFQEHVIHHIDYSDGEIIAHVPGPGEVVVPGADVCLLVSKGKQRQHFRMPDLIGMTITETRGLMSAFQSELEISVSNRREFGPGIVIDQEPKPGNPLILGDHIVLTVTAEDKATSGVPTLFTWNVPHGFLNKNVIITYTVNGDTEILVEREAEPSQEIALYLPNTGKGVLEISLDGKIVFSEVR